MGCGASKIDDSPLVALCRERKDLIRDAADLRYTLASVHSNYLRSLSGIGDAVQRFAEEELVQVLSPPPSPAITFPTTTKSKSVSDGSVTSLSHSLSPDHEHDGDGSHIHLSSESGSEKSLKSSPRLSPSYNYLRSSAAIPSMVYQHPYAWDYQYDHPMGSPPRDPAVDITRPPPPQPAAEGGSAWDFFNPFNSYEQFLQQDRYYGMGSGSSSTDSGEVREREGIPDLEEETDKENLRTARKGKRVMDEETRRKEFGEGTSKSMAEKEKSVEEDKGNTSIIENSTEGRAEIKEKEMIYEEESGPSNANSVAARGTRDILVAVKEIKELFNLAAACGEEISRMLEVGKLNYRASSRFLRVFSSRILEPMGLSMLTPSLPFKHSQTFATSAMKNRGNATDFKNRVGMKSLNLSSTLEKLYVWEKKLCKEVKGEEKLRFIYEKKCRHLRYLDNRGAESNKIDSIQASIRRLQMKLSIVIRSVDAISSRMHTIRDNELQPQLVELIEGLMRMWKSMLECHQKQYQAILDNKYHNLMAKIGVEGNIILNTTRELEFQLANWCSSFHDWISTQRSYVEALNGWLMKWLPPEVEETPDGIVPFSPSRIEAPHVFIVSNDWNNALRRVSEAEVMTAMHNFAVNVHLLLESQEEEQRQKQKAEYISRDYARRLNTLQNDSRMHGGRDIVSVTDSRRFYYDDHMKTLELMRRRLDEEKTKHEEIVKQIQQEASARLKTGMLPIFEALGDFSSDTVKAYEEIRTLKEHNEGQ